MRALLNEKDPPERATAPVGSITEAALPASFLPQPNSATYPEQAASRAPVADATVLSFPCPAVVAVRMDRRNGHFQVVKLVPGEGGFRPIISFPYEGAAVRYGIERARASGSRFRGVVR